MKKLIMIVGLVALLLSTGINLLMIQRNRQWKDLANTYSQQLSPPLGRKMSPLEGLDGSQRDVSFDVADPHKTTVVFIFSPSCNVCKHNWKNWDAMLASRSDGAWKSVFVNIGLGASPEFRTYHNLQPFPLIEQVSKDSVLEYRMYYTPETLVVNKSGVIIHAWVGLLTLKDLEDFSHEVNSTT